MLLDKTGHPLQDGVVPPPSEEQQQEAEERTTVAVVIVHEAIRRDGEEELRRPVSALAWSGLAARLSMGFSFLAQGLILSYLPDVPWRPLLTSLGYPPGFLITIIGRQQLFTENTLTAIIPIGAQNRATLVAVLRLWAVVLLANLVGAHIFGWVVATGLKPWIWFLACYLTPTRVGNFIGGVTLVSALNHAGSESKNRP